MAIDFICGVLAELFDSPCNFSPMDEYMFQDEYCEHHCGKVEDKDCWKRYFEKRWEDSKVSEIPTGSEKPNNCEDEPSEDCELCKHFKYRHPHWECEFDTFEECNYEPKDEPQPDGYMTAEQTEDYRKMLDKVEHKVYGNIEGEPQTDEEYINNLPWIEVENGEHTDIEIARAIVHKAIDDTPIAEDAYPDLRQKMHDAVDNYEPQTERSE